MIVPVIAIVNFSLVTVKFLGKENQPYIGLKIIFLITRLIFFIKLLNDKENNFVIEV